MENLFMDHFDIVPSGTIVLVQPNTDFAKEWWKENVDSNCARMGYWYCVECRYFPDIRDGFNQQQQGE